METSCSFLKETLLTAEDAEDAEKIVINKKQCGEIGKLVMLVSFKSLLRVSCASLA